MRVEHLRYNDLSRDDLAFENHLDGENTKLGTRRFISKVESNIHQTSVTFLIYYTSPKSFSKIKDI